MYKEKENLLKLGLFILKNYCLRRVAIQRNVPCDMKLESLLKSSNLSDFNLSCVSKSKFCNIPLNMSLNTKSYWESKISSPIHS